MGDKIKKILLLIILFFLLYLVGCYNNTTSSKEVDTIKIGVIEPLTGTNAAGGQMELEGIQLANELYPTVLGKKIELVIMDNQSKKVKSADAAVKLINEEEIYAAIGSWGSSFSIAVGPIFKDAEIPIVGASCTNPLVTLNNDYYSRVCFVDSFQGKVMANFAYNQLGTRKVVILEDLNSDYSVGLSNYFSEEIIKLDGNNHVVIGKFNYRTGDKEFSKLLKTIKELEPDAIFAPGNYTEGALIIKQAREMGIDVPFIGTDTWETPEFLNIGGEAVNGVIISTFFTAEISITKESEKFIKNYREKYKKEPSSFAALGYDAYLVIINAIEENETVSSSTVNTNIKKTKNFEGAAGFITLDSNGDANKSAVIKKVENNEFIYLTIVESL